MCGLLISQSALELQNAESKRVFESGGARRLQFLDEGTTSRMTSGGEIILHDTAGYGSTAATSTLKKMLITKALRVGDGMYTIPASHIAEKLFGETATGRTKVVKLEGSGQKPDYDPLNDSCLDAYVRGPGACCSRKC